MRKRIFTLLFACVMLGGAFMFASCGEKSKPIDYSYTELNALTESMRKDDYLFVERDVDGVPTSYAFKALNGDLYEYYNECFIVPMTYIHRNLPDLANLKFIKNLSSSQKNDINKLNKSIDKMKASLQPLKAQAVNLNNFPSSGTLYEGALQQYQYECTKFILNTYDVAFNLSQIEVTIYNRFNEMKTRALNQDDSVIVRNYLSLKIGKDFTKLLLENSNSKLFTTATDASTDVVEFKKFIDTSKTSLRNFIKYFYAIWPTNLKNLQSEPIVEENVVTYNNVKIDELLNMESVLDEERTILNKSFDKFSVYKFYQEHNCNLKSYSNQVKFADVYYNEIQDYFNSYINLQIEYFKGMLVK